MKKILGLVVLMTLLGSCTTQNFINGNDKGKLLNTYQNVAYFIHYDTHTYEILLEVDKDTHEILKKDTISFDSVHSIPKSVDDGYYRVYNEYLVYEHHKALYVYYKT